MRSDRFKGYAAAAAIFITVIIFTVFPSQTAAAVRLSVNNCLNVIVPSLFAMTVLSGMLIKSGIYKITGKPFSLPARYIFRISPDMMTVFLISCFAGYPVGATLIAAAREQGAVDRDEAERLLCWCFGAGPAFIYGAVGSGVFGSTAAGNTIFISCIAANIIIGLVLSIGRKIPHRNTEKTSVCFSSQLFCQCVAEGGKSILKMCGIIIFMSALLSVPDTLGITARISSVIGRAVGTDPGIVYAILRSAAEVSNIAYIKADGFELLPAAAAVVSFGGISVFMQISSVYGKYVRIGKMIAARCAAAAVSYCICDLLYVRLYREEAVSVMAEVKEIRYNSPIPTIFLLIMTILLLFQKKVVKTEKM
ncbi:MAG: hypothetical protein ACI4XF_06705 [Oscillospiraceae bacterium]